VKVDPIEPARLEAGAVGEPRLRGWRAASQRIDDAEEAYNRVCPQGAGDAPERG
jgi:hypothetical protein